MKKFSETFTTDFKSLKILNTSYLFAVCFAGK